MACASCGKKYPVPAAAVRDPKPVLTRPQILDRLQRIRGQRPAAPVPPTPAPGTPKTGA